MSRRLGQHFLKNHSVIKKIIAALDLKKDDTVIEIGPGSGALTLPLVRECEKAGCKIIAVEKDKKLAEFLRGKLAAEGKKIEIADGDALKALPALQSKVRGAQFRIVGNIPYYITGKLIRVISELAEKPKLAVLTLQKEVAERVTAKPPRMNLLAAAVQIWAKPEIIGYLKPADFDPPPEVESAVIRLTTGDWPLATGELANYYRLIKLIFKQPRKMVLNNLSTGLNMPKIQASKIFERIGFSGSERPHNLSLEALKKLSTFLSVN